MVIGRIHRSVLGCLLWEYWKKNWVYLYGTTVLPVSIYDWCHCASWFHLEFTGVFFYQQRLAKFGLCLRHEFMIASTRKYVITYLCPNYCYNNTWLLSFQCHFCSCISFENVCNIFQSYIFIHMVIFTIDWWFPTHRASVAERVSMLSDHQMYFFWAAFSWDTPSS